MTDLSFAELFYEEDSLGVFLLVSVLLGGGAAWLAGRAIAATWRPGALIGMQWANRMHGFGGGRTSMSLSAYFAFLVATIVLVIVPGPTVTLVIANSLRHGRRAGLLKSPARRSRWR